MQAATGREEDLKGERGGENAVKALDRAYSGSAS